MAVLKNFIFVNRIICCSVTEMNVMRIERMYFEHNSIVVLIYSAIL
jgi:hypothetical protein